MNWQGYSRSIERRDAVGFVLSLGRFFVLLFISFITTEGYAQSPGNTHRQLEAIERTFADLAQRNAYVEDLSFNEEAPVHLPLGMKRTIGGMEITIAVNRFALHTASTELGVYAKAVIPQGTEGKRRVLFFGAEGIRGTHSGGLIGELKLSLLHDVEIPFSGGNMSVVLKGHALSKTRGVSESDTYMTVSCDGFQSLSLDAEVLFPKSLLVPADAGQPQVRGHFRTVVTSWDDLLVSVDLPSFQIKGLKDYIFSLEGVSLDLSSQRNDDKLHFPEEYQRQYMPEEAVLWRGVYANKVSVTLPQAFSRASFSARGLIIDDYGVTGLFAADSILPLERGDASGWRFSVDHFGLNLIASELVSADFRGRLQLPFRGEHTQLGYEGELLADNEYAMRVKTEEALDFSVFNAKAYLDKNSYVSLRLVGEKFLPEATLHGYMALNGDGASSSTTPKLDRLLFRNLRLRTSAPYLTADYLGYEGEAKLGNFPLSIHKLTLDSKGGDRVRLAIGAGINLGEKLFSGETEIGLLARYEERAWVFDKLEVGAIKLDASIAKVINLKGELNWHRDDSQYGDGFAGDVEMGISFDSSKAQSTLAAKIKARAAFGRKDSHRYWYVDGMAGFRPGVPLLGVMTLNGLGGALTSGVRAEGTHPEGGKFSNAHYIPDATMGLGFKASTIFEIGKASYAEAALEMLFTKAGGLGSVGFYGYGEFPNGGGKNRGAIEERLKVQQRTFPSSLSEQFKQNDWKALGQSLKQLPEVLKDNGLSGTLCVQMDLQNRVFHATSDVYINTPGGLLQGIGDRGQAGRGILHIDPREWYLHLGDPSRRLGVQLAVGNILAVKSGSYFMAGSRIPEMPTPPQAVADILGQDLDRLRLGRNLEALSSGRGLAFGSDLAVRTGDLQFLMMYANFHAGLGFDVMLKDYGAAQCRGRSGSVGLNGWYAQGQAYTYLQGELGVKIKLWFLRTRIPVIKGGAAALLQAGLPDPTFFKGYLGVDLNVLGLLKGKARFKLTIGEECDLTLPGSSPVDEPMINDLAPSSGEEAVSVFTSPEATFNVAMGKSFEASNDAGEQKMYRIQLQDFHVKDQQGALIQGKLIWSKDQQSVRFQPKEVLPPNSKLTAVVRVAFEELVGGSWKQVQTSGKPAVEEKQVSFTTGGAPQNIPVQNIVYAYPVLDQRYLLPRESSRGYIQLQLGQKYLFDQGFAYRLSFLTEGETPITSDFTYKEAEQRLEFTLPQLKTSTAYRLELSYRPQEQSTTKMEASQSAERGEGALHIGGDKARAQLNTELEQSILSYNFSTSRFATFTEKIKSLKQREELALDAGEAITLGVDVQGKEAFDEAEVIGVASTQQRPLLSLQSELQEDYFTGTVLPLVYSGYPYGAIRLTNRDEEAIGVPPYRAFSPSQTYLSKLSDGSLRVASFRFPFTYDAGLVAHRDYRDLQGSIVNSLGQVSPEVYRRFIFGTLPVLKYGKYKAWISYVLPDGSASSRVEYFFHNPLKLNR